MEDKILLNNFLKEIGQKIPQKKAVEQILSEILCIDKERMRKKIKGDESFTLYEAMLIARSLVFSLDKLEMSSILAPNPFTTERIENINMTETAFALLEEMTAILKTFKKAPDAEAGEIANILPQPIYMPYKHISRFYLFQWNYQASRQNKAALFKDIIIENKLRKAQLEYVKWSRRLNADYIFDHLLFQYVVNDISYFYAVGLITREEVQQIKEDLTHILDEIDDITTTGVFKDSGKRINIYISDVNISTNYIYVGAPNYRLTIIKAFIINGFATTDKKTFEDVRSWMKSVKQQSKLITRCAEKERLNFLEQQYRLIDSLSQL